MSLLFLLVLLAIFFVLMYIVVTLARRLLDIEKVGESGKYINEYHKWGNALIVIGLVISLIFLFNSSSIGIPLVLFFVVVSHAFDSFMMWKYLHSREYIIKIIKGFFLVLGITLIVLYIDTF